ncbi:hypothetical protein C8Q77DRAFT_369213 [Trametes polyzona]|nr:hypothetical protein C8Q77DRAFT_369213 [Trametes polyzona]
MQSKSVGDPSNIAEKPVDALGNIWKKDTVDSGRRRSQWSSSLRLSEWAQDAPVSEPALTNEYSCAAAGPLMAGRNHVVPVHVLASARVRAYSRSVPRGCLPTAPTRSRSVDASPGLLTFPRLETLTVERARAELLSPYHSGAPLRARRMAFLVLHGLQHEGWQHLLPLARTPSAPERVYNPRTRAAGEVAVAVRGARRGIPGAGSD